MCPEDMTIAMKKMILLQEVVYLPEWETVPAEPDAAIAYLAQWDYGEYHTNPEAVETIYTRNGETHCNGPYVMHAYYDGSHALYRIMEEGELIGRGKKQSVACR